MKKGFTLIEILVSISIIAILMAISFFGIQGAREASRDTKRKSDLEAINVALALYKSDCGSYPVGTYTNYATWPASIVGTGASASCAATNTYLVTPKDPLDTTNYYKYSSATGTTYCIGASLEAGGSGVSCGGNAVCGSGGATCNYVLNNP